jgi:hypothetical protein
VSIRRHVKIRAALVLIVLASPAVNAYRQLVACRREVELVEEGVGPLR